MTKFSPQPLEISDSAPAATNDVDRRQYVRYAFSSAAEVTEVLSQSHLTGRISDLGSGGCYVDTMTPLPVGSRVKLIIQHHDRRFETGAVVSYAHHGLGMGLAFTDMKSKDAMLLQGWLATLGGEEPVSQAPPETEYATPRPALEICRLRDVLNDLVKLMAQKQVLDQEESEKLLRHLLD
jgi:hypothetical protein